ncbi:Isochorismatase hydrolase [Choiromyces venosus 120613-1]|uniref:Isochorismatase hydrolase n=1 Tax=Choiromyces venosus 120613-1 TaxID=1336337 RepID=A0A3N4JY69_9PEZI|nr:Isochorismatase hydrolase [Choiromyces venosus 120613-1]
MVLRGRINNPVLFVCDLQEKFRTAIYGFDKCIQTTQKLLKASQILQIPILATTQLSQKLGPLVPELQLPERTKIFDKSLFSMMTPELIAHLDTAITAESKGVVVAVGQKKSVALVGIESHVCILQTCLDLLAAGHNVYVIADAVSSCNRQEVPIALGRMRRAGAVVTTSESWLYEVMGDAKIEEFRQIAGLVKESKESTTLALQSLL